MGEQGSLRGPITRLGCVPILWGLQHDLRFRTPPNLRIGSIRLVDTVHGKRVVRHYGIPHLNGDLPEWTSGNLGRPRARGLAPKMLRRSSFPEADHLRRRSRGHLSPLLNVVFADDHPSTFGRQIADALP
jgi:hypothetical protein